MTHHLRLNFDLIKLLAGINTNHASNHLWYHNHIPQMRLDEVGLLIWLGFLLRLTQLLDQAHGLALQSAVETTASTRVNDVAELVGGEVQESELRVS